MPSIPQIKIGNTIYDLKDSRFDDIKNTLLDLVPIKAESKYRGKYIRYYEYNDIAPGELINLSDASQGCYTDYVYCGDLERIECWSIGKNFTGIICFYDQNRNFIQDGSIRGTDGFVWKKHTANVPSNAYYVRCSGYADSTATGINYDDFYVKYYKNTNVISQDTLITRKGNIPNNTDANDLISPGLYVKVSGRVLDNVPSDFTVNSGYLFMVLYAGTSEPGEGTDFVYQMIIPVSNFAPVYRRERKSDGTWRDWATDGKYQDVGYQRLITDNYCKLTKCLEQIRRPWHPIGTTMIKSTTDAPGVFTYFTNGETYNLIPYSRVIEEGHDIFFDRNLATFFSAVENPASIVYQPQTKIGRAYVRNNYGAVCVSFVEWLLGMDIFMGTAELVNVMDFYDYHSPEDLEIGDVLARTESPNYGDHTQIVVGIDIDSKTFIAKRIVVAEQGYTDLTTYSPEDFMTRFGPGNATGYRIGRVRNAQIRDIEPVHYANDVIADMGNNTHYYMGDSVFLYIPSGSTLYYKNASSDDWSSIAKSSLPSTRVSITSQRTLVIIIIVSCFGWM